MFPINASSPEIFFGISYFAFSGFFYTFKTEQRELSNLYRDNKFIIFLFFGQALDLLVLISLTRYRAYTLSLSTS